MLLIFTSAISSGQVKFSYYGDTLNSAVKTMTEYAHTGDYEIRINYTYNLSRKIQTANFYFNNSLQGRWVVKCDDQYQVIESGLYYDYDSLCRGLTLTYNTEGREIERHEVHYLNERCNNFIDFLQGGISEWMMGSTANVTSFAHKYDNLGRIVETRRKNFVIGSDDTDTTITVINYTFNNNDDKSSQKKVESFRTGSDYADTSYETTNYIYNRNGSIIEEQIIKSSVVSWTIDSLRNLFKYDAHNNLVEKKEYFSNAISDYSGNLPYPRVGGGTTYTYDSINNRISYSYYWLYRKDDNSEIKEIYQAGAYNEDKEEFEYDTRGNIIKKTRHGTITLKREIEYY